MGIDGAGGDVRQEAAGLLRLLQPVVVEGDVDLSLKTALPVQRFEALVSDYELRLSEVGPLSTTLSPPIR